MVNKLTIHDVPYNIHISILYNKYNIRLDYSLK